MKKFGYQSHLLETNFLDKHIFGIFYHFLRESIHKFMEFWSYTIKHAHFVFLNVGF